MVTLLGVYLMVIGYGATWSLTIATIVLIFGIAIWMMAKPEDYNSMTDIASHDRDGQAQEDRGVL